MTDKRLLVTGAGGMLGQALVACLESRGYVVIALPRERLDVTNYEQVLEQLNMHTPDLVLHCAAYTKVDQAESEPELAFSSMVTAPRISPSLAITSTSRCCM